MVKLVGGVLLWIGVAFGALLLWFGYGIFVGKPPGYFWPLVFLGAVAAIALFCLSVGYRLFFNRPKRYGSILGPVSWWLLAGFWGLLTIGLAGVALITDVPLPFSIPTVFALIIFSGSFAYYCVRGAHRARVSQKRTSAKVPCDLS